MSTREIALGIFNQLTEKQLEGFIAMFRGLYPDTPEDDGGQSERDAAFERIENLVNNRIKPSRAESLQSDR